VLPVLNDQGTTLGDLLSVGATPKPKKRTNVATSSATKSKRPQYKETTTTDFELIKIKGNISKCAACSDRALIDGSDDINYHDFDRQYCIRHKEKDHIFLQQHNYWKPTFSNRHYHICKDCILSRNPSFSYEKVKIRVEVCDMMQAFLISRFDT